MHHHEKPATVLKLSSISKGSSFMPGLQQAISHRLLMTWLAFVGTTPRWNQNHWSLTQMLSWQKYFVSQSLRSWVCIHCFLKHMSACRCLSCCERRVTSWLCYQGRMRKFWAFSAFKTFGNVAYCLSVGKSRQNRVHVSLALWFQRELGALNKSWRSSYVFVMYWMK